MHIDYVEASSCLERVSQSTYYKQQKELKDQHEKILSTLKRNKMDAELYKILEWFFRLEDEKGAKESEGPTVHMIAYLGILTAELTELLVKKKVDDLTFAVFELFIRFNFNKETVFKYFRDKLKKELIAQKGEERKLLNRWLIESENTSVRVDMAYNINRRSLAFDMTNEATKQKRLLFNEKGGINPLLFKVPATVYCILFAALIKNKVIDNPVSYSTIHQTIKDFTRGPDEKEYELSSVRNSFTEYSKPSLKHAKLILKDALLRVEEFEEDMSR